MFDNLQFSDLIPVIALIIFVTGAIAWYKIRTSYKILQMKEVTKAKKKESTFEGTLEKMIDDAPAQLQQINSELATIHEKARRENLTEQQLKSLTSRLESEKTMLEYATKYGEVAKMFVKPIGGFVNKITNSLGV